MPTISSSFPDSSNFNSTSKGLDEKSNGSSYTALGCFNISFIQLISRGKFQALSRLEKIARGANMVFNVILQYIFISFLSLNRKKHPLNIFSFIPKWENFKTNSYSSFFLKALLIEGALFTISFLFSKTLQLFSSKKATLSKREAFHQSLIQETEERKLRNSKNEKMITDIKQFIFSDSELSASFKKGHDRLKYIFIELEYRYRETPSLEKDPIVREWIHEGDRSCYLRSLKDEFKYFLETNPDFCHLFIKKLKAYESRNASTISLIRNQSF